MVDSGIFVKEALVSLVMVESGIFVKEAFVSEVFEYIERWFMLKIMKNDKKN